ncbi:MAG: hypothetical protein R6W81_02235 [Bacteroidales bacterium]
MKDHRKTLTISGERLRMTHVLCLTIITFALVSGAFALLAAPAECSEIYTSANSTFPYHFENNHNSADYQTKGMDVVYFAGREMIFFTHKSNYLIESYLFYYNLVDKKAHWFRIFDYAYNNVWFKTVVFNNVLYIFYSRGDNTIYYRTAIVDYGADGKAWNFSVSDQKTLPAGISSARIRSAVVMNGQLYIIYSDLTNTPRFYYISSSDGLKFGSGTLFFTSPASSSSWSSDATVFMVADATGGAEEKMMIAYAPGGSTIYYFFFDGKISYGHWYENTGLSNVRSVRLFVGTAEGYTKNKYVIQVFCATPTSNSAWDYMYHGEYTPSGIDGEKGDWSPTWNQLSQSSDDHVYDLYEPNWAIIPYFQDEDANQRMKLRIWYSKNTKYHWVPLGYGYETFEFRSSTYKSDLLEHINDTGTRTEPDMTACPIVGVILGTPPYPENNGVPTADSARTSTVELETTQTVTFATTWTATAGTAVSYGKKFGPVNMQAKLTAGVKRSKQSTTGKAVYHTDTLKSYNDTGYPGGLAWALYLKPAFLTDQYILKSYDGTQLTYDGNSSELRVSVMTYDGFNTSLQLKAFYIDDPGSCIGGSTNPDCSTQIFAGMEPFPKSSDFCAWDVPVTSTDFYKIPDYGYLPSIHSTQGDTSYTKYTETTTNAVTNGWSAGFSTSAGAFGFTAEGSVNYSMDFTTTTSMTQSLGFSYGVPSCGGPGSTTACISDATVYPYLLIPNEDATGYNAPWISDDIRNFQKPKPWAITYSGIPSNKDACIATSSLPATWIEVRKIHGTLFLNERNPNRDRLSAKISLIVPPDFLMDQDDWMHLRFGNYFADSDRLQVISRTYKGKNLVLELKGPNPDSSITVTLSHNIKKSRLDIDLDADRIDLTPLFAYRFLGAGQSTDENTDFGLYLGGKYFVKSELGVHCAFNQKNGVCNFNNK